MHVRLILLAILLSTPLSTVGSAQAYQAFATRPEPTPARADVGDVDLDGLLSTLDQLVASAPKDAWRERAGDAVWQFARRLQSSRLSPEQENRVLAHLDTLSRSRAGAAGIVAGPKRLISALRVGKLAPDISGRDLDGKPFKLSEYRGKAVLLVFSADWCAICRAQAPYERFLLDRYANWPFAILGVETGSSRDTAKQAHANGPLTHRSWWDEPRTGAPHGPIANAWHVIGWPTTYLIDGDGIIQYVNVREEELLVAVRRVVEAEVDRETRPAKAKPPR